jgi:hypothetical protein
MVSFCKINKRFEAVNWLDIEENQTSEQVFQDVINLV